MKKKYQNIFFLFGIVVLVFMAYNLDFAMLWTNIRHAGYWFIAVLALWLLLYLGNTLSWYLIIQSGAPKERIQKVSFAWLYKITVSAFALNYATPGGLMGGEPYRIMELSPKIGTERATSSVLLFVMTHIFCHFLFWLLCLILFLFTQPLHLFSGVITLLTACILSLGIWFFMHGYRKGMAVSAMQLCNKIPLIKRYTIPFVAKHQSRLETIDRQIAALHHQNRKTFLAVVCLETLGRIGSALEVMFILLVLMPQVNFLHCMLIIAYTSLVANILFFMPLQLVGREGGFILSATQMGFTASTGVFVALIIRVRELIWTATGLLLIKLNKAKQKDT